MEIFKIFVVYSQMFYKLNFSFSSLARKSNIILVLIFLFVEELNTEA